MTFRLPQNNDPLAFALTYRIGLLTTPKSLCIWKIQIADLDPGGGFEAAESGKGGPSVVYKIYEPFSLLIGTGRGASGIGAIRP